MADNHDQVATVLHSFARALTTDFAIQGILDHLVGQIVEVLPVSGAGVTLLSAESSPTYVAASNNDALEFEWLQSDCRDGPCLQAYQTGEPVAVPDLSVDDRFPSFAPPALEAGLAAVFTFPLRHGEGCIGALDLYCDAAGPLSRNQTITAGTMADVVSACLINAQARDAANAASDGYLHNSLHDPLTRLPNRALLLERLHQARHRAKRSQLTTAVCFVDLDRFKLINDHHGHHVGDQLLVEIAQRFTGLLRSGDTVARISGDEFVFLCEDIRDDADTRVIESRISAAFEHPFIVDGLRLSIAASIGMSVAKPGEAITEELIARADTAMYLVKRHRGGRRRADAIDSGLTEMPQNFEEDLRGALESDLLSVAYQPIVRASDSMIVDVEALLRWSDPTRGSVAPLMMIGTAERSSLINSIGGWVLDRSCAAHAAWLSGISPAPIGLTVNVSARQLVSGDLVRIVEHALAVAGLDPTALVLEMTENLLIEDSERAMRVLGDLRRLGVRIALDDFGTGYSSLSYLTRLPIDIVKIDQRLIAGVGVGPESVVVSAVTQLAHELGMVVVAEGVETKAQHDEIIRIGCDHSQGFYFGRPMSESAIQRLDWTLPLRADVVSAAES